MSESAAVQLARVGHLHLAHLTEHDTVLLAEVATAVEGRPVSPRDLRSEPGRLLALFGHPRTHHAVFGPGERDEPFLQASPFLTFAVAVHRAAEGLAEVTFTEEWVGARQRLPVFDVSVLRDFVADPLRRLFLVELLASYTHVASGSTWVRTGRGWRRRRFSELDPVRLASLLEVVGEAERPGIYRRLGDVALFLTGVFPDHTALRGLQPVDEARLLRAGGLHGSDGEDLPVAVAQLGAVGLLEELGRRWYLLAARDVGMVTTGTMQPTAEVARRFRDARRVLNHVTDRFLFPFRSQWFGTPTR